MTTKIAFLADGLYGNAGGGTERQFLKLCKVLPEHELDIHVFFLKHLDVHDTIAWRKTPHTLGIYSLARLSTLKKVKEFIAILDERNIKVVQTFFDSGAIIGALVKLLRPDILVVGSLRNNGHSHTRLSRIWLGLAFRKLDHTLINASIISEHLNKNLCVDSSKTSVIYNILEPQSEQSLTALENKFYTDLKANFRCVFTLVGNLKPLKGIDDLIKAIHQLNDTSIAFCLIGGGNQVDQYRDKVSELGIEQQCFILGPQENVFAHLQQTDAAIQASHSEGLSNSLIEYLFSGLPTIATDVGGSAEILEYGKMGTLIPARNPAALASEIENLANNLTHATKSAADNIQPTAEKYSAHTIAEQYKSCYLTLLEHSPCA